MIKDFIPTAPQVIREAIIVMAGALLAVIILKQLPLNIQSMFNINSIGEQR